LIRLKKENQFLKLKEHVEDPAEDYVKTQRKSIDQQVQN